MSLKFKHLSEFESELRNRYKGEVHGRFRAIDETKARFQREPWEANIPDDVPNAKRDLLFRIAWDLGHCGGCEEVESCYNDLVPLVL